MPKKLIKILLIVVVFTAFGGCKTIKKTVIAEKETEAQLLLTAVQKAEPKFTSIEFKRMNIGINLNEKTRYNSGATCKIIPDSVIQISVQPFFGIEMFIARLTPKNIIVIDKIKGIYYQTDYSIFEKQFGITINYLTFESLLSNKHFFIHAKSKADKVSMNAMEKNGKKTLTYKNNALNQHFSLNDNYRILEMVVNSQTGNEQFVVKYSDFTQTGSITFPYSIGFQLKNNTELFSFNMSISRFGADEKISIPELNLNQYKQGSINSLFK